MESQRVAKMLGLILAGTVGMLPAGAGRVLAQPENPAGGSGVEVLTRGPVHEAFAVPGAYNPAQGMVVTQEPPPAIEEIPPAEKPVGENVRWVPGYWSWDDDRSDFIWVSGIWRIPPPGCSWVPGYWTPVAGGWTWTSGFWMAAEANVVQYLPPPPASLEVGPSSPQPAADYLWTPGCWFWTGQRYAWRPGYWVLARPEWVWVPSHYVWTPRGCVYVDGYWDWSIEQRGVLFAPVYVPRVVYIEPQYVYSPWIVIQTSCLTAALFIAPSCHHYFFGDYYGDVYFRRGYHPWFRYDRHHHGYDPIYVHQRWRHERNDPHWGQHQRDDYDHRVRHADSRPSRTYSSQEEVVARAPENERENLRIAAPITEVSSRQDPPVRFVKIDSGQRQALGGEGKQLAKYREERATWESDGRTGGNVKSTKPDVTLPQEPRRQPIEMPKGTSPRLDKQPNLPSRQLPEIQQPPKGRTKIDTPSRSLQPIMPDSVKIPKSPVFGQSPGVPNQAGNPPGRPDSPKLDLNGQPRTLTPYTPRTLTPDSPRRLTPDTPRTDSFRAPAPSAPSGGPTQDPKGGPFDRSRNQ